MFHWYTNRPMHGLPHFMFTYHSYTCMSCFYIPVTHAYWFLYSCHMDSRSHYMYYCSMLPYSCYTVCMLYDCFLLLIWIFPLLDLRAVDMRYVKFHIYCSCFPLYCSRFPLYCSMLSTELRSSYQVNCIMYCICA